MILPPTSTEDQKLFWKKYPVKVMLGKEGINSEGEMSHYCKDLFYSKEGDSTLISIRELIKFAKNFKNSKNIDGNILDMNLFIIVDDRDILDIDLFTTKS